MFAAIAAGAYSGLQAFIDAAMFATVVFAPAGLPLDVGIQHALLGSVITQTAVTYLGTVLSTLALVPCHKPCSL